MPALRSPEKKHLLAVARYAIAHALGMKESTQIKPKTMATPGLKRKAGVFVTLTKNHALRGCIGCFGSDKPLPETVAEFACAAAANDTRFPPLRPEEFTSISIEISILSEAHEVNREEFLTQLPTKPGVIIRKSMHTATFLPQVWEQLPEPEEFMGELCLKAGLPPMAWHEDNMRFLTYTVDSFEE